MTLNYTIIIIFFIIGVLWYVTLEQCEFKLSNKGCVPMATQPPYFFHLFKSFPSVTIINDKTYG